MSEPTDEVAVDRPEVLAQVRAVFDRYERALVDGDIGVLGELIWDDERTVRFGVADRQHGAAEIAAWRAKYPSVPPGRRLHRTTVLAVDDRTAVVSTLFDYPGGMGSQLAGGPVEGRQTQVWVRFTGGWRIVAAHVSEISFGP